MFTSLRPLAHILCQISPVHSVPFCFFKIRFNFSLSSTPGCSKLSLSVRFPHRNPLCVLLSSPPCVPHAPLIILHSITLIVPVKIVSVKQYKSRSSLCNFLHSPVTSSHSTLFSNTLSRCPSPNMTKFLANVTQPAKL